MGPAPEGGGPLEIRGRGADRTPAGLVRQHPGPQAAPGRMDRPRRADDLARRALRRSGLTRQTATTFTPGPTPNTVRAADSRLLTVPGGWTFLPPGDAGLTRRVKAAGDHWVVQEKVGRKMFSRGSGRRRRPSTASGPNSTPSGPPVATPRSKRPLPGGVRRPRPSTSRTSTGRSRVPGLPSRPRRPRRTAGKCRDRARHAGRQRHGRQDKTNPGRTAGRSRRIAWMRHRTTGYDGMVIPRVKGNRRELRRRLARRSQELLDRYRRGEPIGDDCPLKRALAVEDPGGMKVGGGRR